VKLVELTRQGGEGSAAVVAAVGPMQDTDAETYAAGLRELVERQAAAGLDVRTTQVESTSGAAAEPPADPAGLLRAVLSRADGGPGPGHGI
jgi:hypothetical protein